MSIYVREKSHGKWRYRRIKEGRGFKTGELIGPFFSRPFISGKQVWRRLYAANFDEAKEAAEQLDAALDAADRGLTVAEAQALTDANRITVRSAIEDYLDKKKNKAPKTLAQYRLVLNQFVESLGSVRFLDEINNRILHNFKIFLEKQGYAGKTIDTRLNIVFFLLKKNDIKARIPRDEMPVVEEEPAVPYTAEELEKLFASMTDQEMVNGKMYQGLGYGPVVRYKFFLGTACRDQEVTYAVWQDIDWDRKEYHIRRKDDVGFKPKSHESRTVPLPDSLVELLKARRKNPPHSRWIFVNQDGNPENHFLRKLKAIALRAGLNCGQCKTTLTKGRYEKHKVEVTCKTDPVCQHFYLHRFRKTCATRWHEAGIPVRTIQKWLAHVSLETTQIYLGVTDSDKLRPHINKAFGD